MHNKNFPKTRSGSHNVTIYQREPHPSPSSLEQTKKPTKHTLMHSHAALRPIAIDDGILGPSVHVPTHAAAAHHLTVRLSRGSWCSRCWLHPASSRTCAETGWLKRENSGLEGKRGNESVSDLIRLKSSWWITILGNSSILMHP